MFCCGSGLTHVPMAIIDSGADDQGVRFVRDSRIAETVGRAEYGWKGGKNDWQLSFERAFNSLDGVMGLLRTREAFLAGWVHYLAFDLFTGAWEAETAPRARVPHAVLLICLFLTFMAGPVGLLSYLLVKATRQR